jgi:hypothetical protein
MDSRWNVPQMTILGALVALVVGVFRLQDAGSIYDARAYGMLAAYAMVGGLLGAVLGWWLRSRQSVPPPK